MGDLPNLDSPLDPITALASGAIAMRETFLSYLAAGFTEEQGLYLIGQLMRIAFEAAAADLRDNGS
jgi:hypothetical protein